MSEEFKSSLYFLWIMELTVVIGQGPRGQDTSSEKLQCSSQGAAWLGTLGGFGRFAEGG